MPVVGTLYEWSALTAHIYGARGDVGTPPDDGNGRHWYEADYDESGSWLIDATWSLAGSGPYFPLAACNDAGNAQAGATDPVTGGQFRSAIEGLFGGDTAYGRIHIPDQIRSGVLGVRFDDAVSAWVNGTLVGTTFSGAGSTPMDVDAATWAARSAGGETIIAFTWNQAFSPGSAAVDFTIYDVVTVADRASFVRGGQMPNGGARGGQYGHGRVRGGQNPR